MAEQVRGVVATGEKQPVTWGVFPLMGPDALYVRWNGGGGIGDPLLRDSAQVLADLVQGTVSERAAAEIYGVVISNGAVDQAQTQARRRSLRERVAAPDQGHVSGGEGQRCLLKLSHGGLLF